MKKLNFQSKKIKFSVEKKRKFQSKKNSVEKSVKRRAPIEITEQNLRVGSDSCKSAQVKGQTEAYLVKTDANQWLKPNKYNESLG